MQPYNSTDASTAWINSLFVLSEKSDFHMVDNLLIAVHASPMRMLISLSVDKLLLMRYMIWTTNFKALPYKEEIVPS